MNGPTYPLVAGVVNTCHRPFYCGVLWQRPQGSPFPLDRRRVWHCPHGQPANPQGHPTVDEAVACAEAERPYQQMLLNVPSDAS